jgi:periplasmic protein TonB
MLEDALFESQRRKKKRNPITVALSIAAHVIVLGVLVLVPLLQTQALTLPKVDMSMFLPRSNNTRPPVDVFTTRHAAPNRTNTAPTVFTQPTILPTQIVLVDEPSRSDGLIVPFNNSPTGIDSLISKLSNRTGDIGLPVTPPSPPPPPPTPPPAVDAHPVRVSEGAQAAILIYQVKPVYPPLARQARVQGVVVLEAVISKEGTIESLRAVSGHPLLNQAALDAVKQWRYRPTLLSGEPVAVVTTVTVTFTLQ